MAKANTKRRSASSPSEDYAKLDVHQFDKLVSQRVLGHVNVYGSYSTNDNAVRHVRNRIAELSLIAEYRMALARLVWPPNTPPSQFKGADEFAFLFEQATPRMQCEAALAALDAKAESR